MDHFKIHDINSNQYGWYFSPNIYIFRQEAISMKPEHLVEAIIDGKRKMPHVKNIELAIKGVSPLYIGDAESKEIVAYARAIFDPLNANRTAVPIMLLAKSGLGKTKFLEGLVMSMGADIFGANDITGAGLGMIKHGQIVSARFSHVIGVDEIEKYEAHNIHEALLPLAEAEDKARVRHAIKFLRETGILMVGVCLKDMGGLRKVGGAERRVHAILQLFRRCVLLKLEADQPEDRDDYTRMILGQTKELYKPKQHLPQSAKDSLAEYGRMFITAEVGKQIMQRLQKKISFEDEDWSFNYVQSRCKGFHLEDSVEWGRKMERNLTLLAAGRALLRGELNVKKEDFTRVGEILCCHAQDLGYWDRAKQGSL